MLTNSAGYLPLEVPPKQNLYVRKLHLYVRSARVVARLASQAATGGSKAFPIPVPLAERQSLDQ
jgi:hypothetical protein